ncbi:GNAT family N-acetyltransferase [Halopseudomonas litoralis]|nr:GNAT family N-acetyltransferase [Halopseudomonas litoralis]
MTQVAQMRQAAPAIPPSPLIELTTCPDALAGAQALRYWVFAEECGARLSTPVDGLDIDEFDTHCEHLLVRDRLTGNVVATTRLLDSEGSKRTGSFYSGVYFFLTLSIALPPIAGLTGVMSHRNYDNLTR